MKKGVAKSSNLVMERRPCFISDKIIKNICKISFFMKSYG